MRLSVLYVRQSLIGIYAGELTHTGPSTRSYKSGADAGGGGGGGGDDDDRVWDLT